MPVHLALLTFALVSWMKALALVLGFPVRIGPPLLWALDAVVIATAWLAHVYFAARERGPEAETSPVALAVWPLVICTSFSLLVAAWADFLPSLGYIPVLVIPALLLGGWVVRNARPRT